MDRTNMYSLVLLVYRSDTRCYGEDWVKGTWNFSVHIFCNLLCTYSYFKKNS